MTDIKITSGNTLPAGFLANGIHCGLSHNPEKKELSLIYSQAICNAAAVYTTNKVKGAPIVVDKEHLSNGRAQAIICNSVTANTCSPDGEKKALEVCAAAAEALGISQEDMLIASTGLIGASLKTDVIKSGIPSLVAGLSADGTTRAIEGIMTTDTVKKERETTLELGGKLCTITAIAKGSGMIHPNMATMLSFIMTDAAISPTMLQAALSDAVSKTFNMMSVDGDTSTNDTVCIFANGLAGNTEIVDYDEAFDLFYNALLRICEELVKAMAADGEGASRLMICDVSGAKTEEDAQLIARSVISSSLVKAAVFGSDPNWGRVICAAGYSGADFNPEDVEIRFSSSVGSVLVCEKGRELEFDEDLGKQILSEDEVHISLKLADGDGCAVSYGCDLTYEYVKINGEYRT